MSRRANFAFAAVLVAFSLMIAATATAGTERSRSVPWWGDPQGCYYGANWKCWVYSHTADQGRTSCQVVDIGYDPGHVGPFGLKRANAAEIADVAVGEGYQWAGGCYDNDDQDARPNVYPRMTKSTLGEGPDCSGLVWRVWRESNVPYSGDTRFYFWQRSTYDHGPYDTYAFENKTKDSGTPHVRYDKSGLIMMDGLVSNDHIALVNIRIDAGSDVVWEALGEAYGTNVWVENYRSQTQFSGVRRLAWG